MSNIILFDEEQNIVEIQYEGVNAQLLAELDVRLTDLESQTAIDYYLLNLELNALQTTVHNLALLLQQNYDDIQKEIHDREDADNQYAEAFALQIIAAQQAAADAIQNEANTRAAALLAEAAARGSAISTLETQFNTDISSLASTVAGIATNVAGNTASIITINDALSTETETRAAQIVAIQADFETASAAVLEESVARADADEALSSRLEIVEVDFDGVYAAISAEATARASADSAQSSLITAATATANGAATAVVTEQSARIAADGSIEAKYTIKIDVNGSVSGYGLISTNNGAAPSSEFVVSAGAFKVFNGSTGIAPFSVSGGVTYLDNLVVRSTVRQGQTAFDTGAGFWLGDNAGTPMFSIGNSGANKLTWDGSHLNVVGAINITNSANSFTPNWSGFSVAPTGNLSYLDLGAVVILWAENSITGTSDSASMSFTGLPLSIRPSGVRSFASLVIDNGGVVSGGGFIQFGGVVVFHRVTAAGPSQPYGVGPNAIAFSTVGSKGLGSGWLVIYPK
jgi:hypothetical protein